MFADVEELFRDQRARVAQTLQEWEGEVTGHYMTREQTLQETIITRRV